MDVLTFEVDGAFRTSGARVAQAWVGSPGGADDVQAAHAAMREVFSAAREQGRTLRRWMDTGRSLALDGRFFLVSGRARQTDLDNLLKDLFNQLLLGVYPELTPHARSRKDRYFYEVLIRKVEVPEISLERSVIAVRPA
jgi:hypothetical protein